MDKNQKCEDSFGQSLSSSSRRVMWKLNGEEETFDSLVNCRRLPVPGLCVTVQKSKTSSNSDHDQTMPPSTGSSTRQKRSSNENWLHLMKELRSKKTNMENPNSSLNSKTSATSLQEESKLSNSKAHVATYWHHLFGKISQMEQGNQPEAVEEETTAHSLNAKPSLGLRYKPSHESLKLRQSKEHQAISSKPRLVMTEPCGLPPQQTCVVREVAPKFAHRMRSSVANDTDSCCSGDLEGPKNSPVVKLSNASSSASHSLPVQQQQQLVQRQRVKTEVISVHVSTPSNSAFVGTNRRTSNAAITKRRPLSKGPTTVANTANVSSASSTAAGNKSSSASASSNGNAAFPTFRQRQQELHRYRVQIEQRRLELLELKIAREREDALHSEILFHKDLQIRENQIKAYEDNDCSNA